MFGISTNFLRKSLFSFGLRNFFLKSRPFRFSPQITISNFQKISKKSKISITDEEYILNLQEQEAFIMEDYEKIIKDLKNNSIPENALPSTMNTLLDFLVVLSKYSNRMEGWATVLEYFESNLEKLQDNEFLKIFNVISKLQIDGLTDEMWPNAIKQLLSRNLSAGDFINALWYLPGIEHFSNNSTFISETVEKIDSFDLSIKDTLSAISFLGALNFDKNHEIWKKLLRRSQTQTNNERTAGVDLSLSSLAYYYGTGNGVDGFKEALEGVKQVVLSNLHKLTLNQVVNCLSHYVETATIDENEVLKIIQHLSPNIESASNFSKGRFTTALIIFSQNHTNFESLYRQGKVHGITPASQDNFQSFRSEFSQNADFRTNSQYYRRFERTLSNTFSENLSYKDLVNLAYNS